MLDLTHQNTKKKINSVFIVTHITYRDRHPFDPIEGPFTSVYKTLKSYLDNVEILQIPLEGFARPVIYNNKNIIIPKFLGYLKPLKYIMDIVLILFFAIKYNLSKKRKKRLMIGIDPLSCFPLIFLKKLLNYKLVFYSVDFNRNRFVHKLLQRAYEKADFLSSSYSDQAWVVCESLGAYKKKHHGIQSLNIPNSAIFNKSIYEDNKRFKKGNKIAWSGSCLTDRQTESLFKVLLEVQKIRPDLEIYLVPIKEHNKFTKFCKKYNLKNCHILKMYSRLEWQQFIAKCDIGIAIYDDQFGSTEFIEPLKIWDFMLGGVPFIISSEPSVSRPIRDSRVAYFLNPHNNIPKDDSLKKFLSKENIKKLEPVCVSIAREFSINKIIKKALVDL